MKSITERATTAREILKEASAYSLRYRDMMDIQAAGDPFKSMGTAYYIGFYAGISCAVNRGYSKKNDPRKGGITNE